MRIEVQDKSRAQTVEVEVLEHDCYETNNYTIEEYTYYQPTQQQIDTGTDRDEKGLIAVCAVCGQDMPNIDVTDSLDEGYDREED